MMPCEGFELELRGAKRTSDCDLGGPHVPAFLVIAIDYNLGPIGEGEVNSDLVPLAGRLVLMGCVERHLASCDSVIVLR